MKTLITFIGFFLFATGLCATVSTFTNFLGIGSTFFSMRLFALGLGSAWLGIYVLNKSVKMSQTVLQDKSE